MEVTMFDSSTQAEQEMVNDHRKTWFVLTRNDDNGWNWSMAMVRELARQQFEVHKVKMPNCPAKLVCVEEIEEFNGGQATDFNMLGIGDVVSKTDYRRF
jgi:hypothetical protein